MIDLYAILTAFISAAIVAYLMFYWDFPRRFFYHGLECSGAIGGGCL